MAPPGGHPRLWPDSGSAVYYISSGVRFQLGVERTVGLGTMVKLPDDCVGVDRGAVGVRLPCQ